VFCGAHPGLYEANTLRLEEPAPTATALEVAAWADRLMASLEHRKVEVFDDATGERLRPGFEALGWHPEVLVWMIHDGPPPAADSRLPVSPADDESIRPLRRRWVDPPFTEQQVFDYLEIDKRVGLRLGARNLAAAGSEGEVIAFARYLLMDDSAEIQNVFVAPEHRGSGAGGALTTAAIARAFADGARRVFILADAKARPRQLYARLGFRPAWTCHEFLRTPSGT
jgi:GNAT superfamily N-acetyltransferase